MASNAAPAAKALQIAGRTPVTSLGRELPAQVAEGFDGSAATVCGAGMPMGLASVLRKSAPATRIAALEPASSPSLSAGRTGSHRMEGSGVGVVPPLLDKTSYDQDRALGERQARAIG
jgi:cysteine synthase